MNSNRLLIKPKQNHTNKQTNKNVYMKIEFQNPVVRLNFLWHIMDIKIAWINPCLATLRILLTLPTLTYLTN